MSIVRDMETREGIIVPSEYKRAFKLKAAKLGVRKGRTVTQVELVDIIGRKVPVHVLLPYLE